MTIDFISTPSLVEASSVDPVDQSSSETPAGAAASFSAMLDRAARGAEDRQPTPDEDDAEESANDPWATFPVPVTFVPAVLPDDPVSIDDEGSDIVEASGADAAVETDRADASNAAVINVATVAPVVDAVTTGVDVSADEQPAAGAPVTAPVVPAARADSDISAAAKAQATSVPESQLVSADDVAALEAIESAVVTSVEKNIEEAAGTQSPAVAREKSTARSQTSARAEAAPQVAAAAAQVAPQPSADDGPRAGGPEPEVRQADAIGTAKGVAARLLRALERAAEHVVTPANQAAGEPESSGYTSSGEPGQQQAFGEWLRDQLTASGTAAPRAQAAIQAAFSLNAPAPVDPRVNAVPGTTSAAELLAGSPILPGDHDVNAQLIQSLKVQFRDGIGEAVLKLKPEQLGAVSISLRVENGGLKASVQADVPAVRQWIESQQDTLRQALAEHGLRLDRLDVDPDGHRQETQDEAREERQPRKRHPRQSVHAEQPVFEVVV